MKLLLSLLVVICMVSLQVWAQCICTAELSQVCGVNGRTYDNRCWLKCSKVKLAHTGPC